MVRKKVKQGKETEVIGNAVLGRMVKKSLTEDMTFEQNLNEMERYPCGYS